MCRCVRLARFENDRTISFIPPDGAFDLMTYRLSTQVRKSRPWMHLNLHSMQIKLLLAHDTTLLLGFLKLGIELMSLDEVDPSSCSSATLSL